MFRDGKNMLFTIGHAIYLSKYALISEKTLKYVLIYQKLAKKSIFIPSLVMIIFYGV